ncbi:hypothetical protein A3J19_00955 [Candidatus Daviesbacteria bacterium RIFCSPLOWO2_02_FULL_41_8]|uniref:Cohesin domain-containing protein n=3 Tax=Candidatus Daviesiibacteriota TaxID=1752718 RepID=A0A1F5NLI4_9BACT|nr:MAG: hypothetical protein A2871_00745 [Candidatus Daviesbacteria bacterium RIFCSPHIGHO2_01_FULL_41_23]OGE33432.1 MAG: hypothetical protein A3D83_00350 [Candidatus Daviesbacteria bacterium RIFCSPHIGHO2_02_FULL_41_10]OGE62422.1 MAG: hypothetical protein A2967_01230 [Candidatus Daviesbacteria bacterium RIFCSPLOWO2_01_FULL_41_32]OGE78576.1 MAG: hypothetical protein A3J19_00955 [Candidatus Daviesbacteria bacterium RIFCSPLOWO2_02_FULL_41_8]
MKKFLPLLFLFLILFLVLPASVFAQTAILELDPANGPFNRGCSFPVNIRLDTGGGPTDGTDAVIFYDSSKLTATSITNGTIYPEYAGNSIDAQKGTINISGYVSSDTNFSGKGILATINFTVPGTAATGATQITFDFDPNNKAKTTDSNVVILQQGSVVDVLNSVVNASYVIGTAPCSTQPTPTPTPGPGSSPAVVVIPIGGYATATPAALPKEYTPPDKLLPTGTQEFTSTLVIIGSILTVLGILGLALL